MITLRASGALLTYPRRELLEALPEIAQAIGASKLLARTDKESLFELIGEMQRSDPLALEERYVALFDRGRATSLHLFEHVHGDSRDRGQAMTELKAVYERAGLRLATNELPDFLPAVLEYLSCRDLKEARDMLTDCAHILRGIRAALAQRGSRYAGVFEVLLGIAEQPHLDRSRATVSPQPEPSLDDAWIDMPAFGPGSPPLPSVPADYGHSIRAIGKPAIGK
jgi:nitrate reductase delta subunit